MRNLVIYSYFETFSSKANLEFFNNYGLYEKQDTDYCLVVNGGICTVNLSPRWNLTVLRENKGHDFAAWKQGLDAFKLEDYDYFVFLNDTVVGPLGERHWIKTFTQRLDQETKLCGISINCLHVEKFNLYNPKTPLSGKVCPHVQSMLWCTDRLGLEIVGPLLSDDTVYSKDELVAKKEIGLSQAFLSSGYNITCILPPYQVDYRSKEHFLNTFNGRDGDVFFPQAYFNKDIDPLQSIFFKNKRYTPEKLTRVIQEQLEITYY
ncbi:Protein containing Rhamnan synthesis F domain [Cedratvirus A11]|uniref:Protein containing Rhamnan synthesis F domain n=1 Tax=Cedratvirus A11 TaxID=1903266 RepID=A0A1M7XUU9_9VIRU|nr:Protein containing Rhamnan synthesis F domain [Cedratvirus A11]SHO33463.1 Protein containing Rhamnan synthesis F domain [Cedratvirus A11]